MKYVLLAATLLATPATAAPTATTTTQLPRTVRPLHYDIALKPDAVNASFASTVRIDLDVVQPTRSIVLNAVDLKFSSASLDTGGKRVAAERTAVDAAAQTATFTFASAIAPGRHTLALDYTGVIGTQATGLFSLDYQTTAGKRRALYTQFEAPDARRMIPSWDEPSYKATFTLSADVPKDQMAVSNMPVASRVETGDRARVTFAPTPRMSTYLLFFGLGDFERRTAMAGVTEIGVVTKKGSGAQAQFALDEAVTILKEYNDYFGTPYPLPKLDNIAAPGSSQFFGAMENWGAIFTFEADILQDPTISTQADKQRAYLVAAHEMAHQWFGDLVTMSWWDDLWLNEGFASWMESRTTAKLKPEWNTRLASVGGREAAIAQDALRTTHPIVQKIATVDQASQAFDSITYQKGEAVIRMLEGYVGADAWRDGVRRYMKAHAYGNTVSDDLWREMDKSGKPVTSIAHEFTLQPGVPLINVAVACTGGQSVVTLTQGEFTRDKRTAKPLTWQVPVLLRGHGAPVTALVDGSRAEVRVPGCDPVVVNAGQSGYFRTLYTPADFAKLGAGFTRLDAIDQLGIISDSWALGLTGRQPSYDALELAQRLPVDADPQIWGRVTGIVASLSSNYYREDNARRATFRSFGQRLLKPAFKRVGWTARTDEAPTVGTLRNQLIGTLGEIGDADVIAEARRRYASGDATAMTAAIRKAVLGVVAFNADAATWDKLRAAARSETTPLIRDQYFGLLGSTADLALAKRALDLALTDEPGATNSPQIISAVAGEHPELAFDFAVANRAAVEQRVDTSSRSRYFARLAAGSIDPAIVARLRAYATANIAKTSRRPVEEAIASIGDRLRVRRERLPELDAWLARNGG